MDRTEAVGAVVVRGDGRVLVIRRGKAPRAGIWTLPGGHVERGETHVEAAAREVLEETGLATRVLGEVDVVLLDVLDEATPRAFAIHEMLCVPLDDDAPITAGDDAADARWTTTDERARLGVAADAEAVIARALETLRRGAHG